MRIPDADFDVLTGITPREKVPAHLRRFHGAINILDVDRLFVWKLRKVDGEVIHEIPRRFVPAGYVSPLRRRKRHTRRAGILFARAGHGNRAQRRRELKGVRVEVWRRRLARAFDWRWRFRRVGLIPVRGPLAQALAKSLRIPLPECAIRRRKRLAAEALAA